MKRAKAILQRDSLQIRRILRELLLFPCVMCHPTPQSAGHKTYTQRRSKNNWPRVISQLEIAEPDLRPGFRDPPHLLPPAHLSGTGN
jgi:hypothetical protein